MYKPTGYGYNGQKLNDPLRPAPGVGTFTGLGSSRPEEDPTFNAYMRGIGVNESNLSAEIALRNNRLTQQSQQQAPVFAEQLENGTRQIGGNFEDRGSFNSGRRMYDQTQFGADVARNKNMFDTGIQSQRDDLQMQLASQIASNRQGQAEQSINAQRNVALSKASAGMYQ